MVDSLDTFLRASQSSKLLYKSPNELNLMKVSWTYLVLNPLLAK